MKRRRIRNLQAWNAGVSLLGPEIELIDKIASIRQTSRSHVIRWALEEALGDSWLELQAELVARSMQAAKQNEDGGGSSTVTPSTPASYAEKPSGEPAEKPDS